MWAAPPLRRLTPMPVNVYNTTERYAPPHQMVQWKMGAFHEVPISSSLSAPMLPNSQLRTFPPILPLPSPLYPGTYNLAASFPSTPPGIGVNASRSSIATSVSNYAVANQSSQPRPCISLTSGCSQYGGKIPSRQATNLVDASLPPRSSVTTPSTTPVPSGVTPPPSMAPLSTNTLLSSLSSVAPPPGMTSRTTSSPSINKVAFEMTSRSTSI